MSKRSERLLQAVQAEAGDIRSAFQLQLQQSSAEQRKQGLLLFPLNIISQDTTGSFTEIRFTVSFPINDTFFRKGCSVRCIAGDSFYEGRMRELDDRSGTFTLYDEDLPNFRDEQVSLQFIPDDRTLKCMELACRLLDEHPQLIRLQQETDQQKTGITEAFSDKRLNAQQQLAAGKITGQEPLVLIQGPPGTGKTHTLAIAIQELVRTGKRIIVSAPSNTAVDNLCHALLDLQIPLLRVGNEEKTSDRLLPFTPGGYLEKGPDKNVLDHLRKSLRKADEIANRHIRNYTVEAAAEKKQARKERTTLLREIRQTETEARSRLLQQIPVIAGTPVGLFNELPKTFMADCVIMDEAGQCLEPLAWLTASFGKRLVLCGDPQQLPPVVFSQKAVSLGLNESLLEQAGKNGNMLVLNEQYRMVPEIVASINPYFYNNVLETHFKERSGEIRFIDMAGYGDGEQQDENSGSTFHRDEAEITRTIIQALELSAGNTVVLSPYNAQLGILRQLLPDFRISTIDAIQGQESDCVIISLTRSNPDQNIGFLKDYRRTNVAISRARYRCILIGDSSTLGADRFYNELIGFIEQNGIYQSAWEFAT